MTTARKSPAKKQPAATKKTPPPVPKKTPPKVRLDSVSDGERQAMLEAYHALKQADLPIPEQLQVVDDWIKEIQAQREVQQQAAQAAEQKRKEELAEANKNGPWYVRNCYPAPFNLRLDRQTEKRRLELKARGTPGDIHPIKDEDLRDPILKQNLQIGLIEIIPAGEAQSIIEKQTTNMSQRVHAPLAMLRNELDQPYKQGQVKVEAEFNSQGVTVAQVQPGLMQGQLHDKQIGGTRGSGGLTRVQPGAGAHQHPVNESQQATSVVHSGFVPTGGHPAAVQMGAEAHARAVDDLARRRGGQGPQAGLGDVQVVIDPVQRT